MNGCGDKISSDGQAATVAKYDSSSHKYGYIDKTGNMVIAQRFDQAQPFSEGLASVNIGSSAGYIDKNGKFVVEPQYIYAFGFSEGLAAVSRYNPDKETMEECGYIDASGETVIDFDFTHAGSFSEGLAGVRLSEPGGLGFIDRQGNMVIEPRFDEAQPFSEGLAVFAVWSATDNGGYDVKYGYTDKTGKIVAEARYDAVGSFYDGLAAVGVKQADGSLLYGFMDKNFEMVIEPQFEEVGSFSEGYATVRIDDEGETYIDKAGNILTEKRYKMNLDAQEGFGCGNFSEGMAAACYLGKWGYIDTSGNFVISPAFNMAGEFRDELAPVQ